MAGKINPHSQNIPASKPKANPSRECLEAVDLVEGAVEVPNIPAPGTVKLKTEITRGYDKSAIGRVKAAARLGIRPLPKTR